ncbi:MAG: trehalose-6-phosphate synthase [Patescibacteria group bacterium]
MRKRKILLIVTSLIVGAILIAVGFTFEQARQEKQALSADLEYRTRLLAEGLKESIEPNYVGNSTVALQKIVEKFANRERLVGLAIYDTKGSVVASSAGVSGDILDKNPLVGTAMDSNKPASDFIQHDEKSLYVFVDPLHQDDRVVGAFLVVQNAGYIDVAIARIWENNLLRLATQIAILLLIAGLLVYWIIIRPLVRLVESVKAARMSGQSSPMLSQIKDHAFFKPLVGEISKMTKSLSDARFSASEEARMRLEKIDSPWTAERLREFTKAHLKERKIFLAFNREPYTHQRVKNEIKISSPAGGASTALEPIMEACGGLWFAHGSGNADKEFVDEHDKIEVPQEHPKYTLKRLWFTDDEVAGFHKGFCTEGLWPLCHIAHVRPIFRKSDWLMYRKVNGKYAKAILEEIKDVENPIILINDYHITLLPRMIKDARPDARIGLFLHIPWPSAESFSICPWRKEILDGMLGADVIGFNTQQFCNNLIDTVGKEIESLVDLERFAIKRNDHVSYIRCFPVSISFTNSQEVAKSAPNRKTLDRLSIKTPYLGLGVDRLDYIKGIPERFRGIEIFLDAHPEYREKFTFLQISSPHRQDIKMYQEYRDVVVKEAERINKKFSRNDWKPIVLELLQYSHEELSHLYKLAHVCVITSLHDSMNLVAKEYAAARNDEQGALVLSQFAGSSRDLRGAIVVNPYNAEEVAEAIFQGLAMSPTEQRRRMKKMRDTIKNYNIYRWAAEFIKSIIELG